MNNVIEGKEIIKGLKETKNNKRPTNRRIMRDYMCARFGGGGQLFPEWDTVKEFVLYHYDFSITQKRASVIYDLIYAEIAKLEAQYSE